MKTTRIQLDLTDHQITKLRELMDALPISGYADLVAPVLKALPFEHESVAIPPSGADADAPLVSSQGVRSFSLHAFTLKGRERLPEIEKLLSRLPHVGDL